MSKITTSKWEAWIDVMPIQPTPGGTLHVIGEVDTHSANFAFLKKRNPQGINPRILILDLKVQTGIAPATNPQQVRYNEPLQERNPYDSIEIYYDGALEAKIENIKIVQ